MSSVVVISSPTFSLCYMSHPHEETLASQAPPCIVRVYIFFPHLWVYFPPYIHLCCFLYVCLSSPRYYHNFYLILCSFYLEIYVFFSFISKPFCPSTYLYFYFPFLLLYFNCQEFKTKCIFIVLCLYKQMRRKLSIPLSKLICILPLQPSVDFFCEFMTLNEKCIFLSLVKNLK